MYRYLFVLVLFSNLLFSQDIGALLKELESNDEKSLYTVDEKLGNLTVYSQRDLRLMQYTTLSDLLKEMPFTNLNRNRYGAHTLSVSGSKADISGFFKVFINDHEISSNYTNSSSVLWSELPMELVDYIEVYRGDSSFTLGSDNGVFFIRVYTKKAHKINGSIASATLTSNGSSLQNFLSADSFANGWSYLAFINNSKVEDEISYKSQDIGNDSRQQYLYFNFSKDKTDINFGYSRLKKDLYVGMSYDAHPDYGLFNLEDYFLNFTTYFLEDDSLKLKLSYDANNRDYNEINKEGIGLTPVLDLTNMGLTIPQEYHGDAKFTKHSALISKSFKYGDNNFLIGLNHYVRKYKTKQNSTVNFAYMATDHGAFNEFDKEEMYSLFFQDDYKLSEQLLLVANLKLDKYKRTGSLSDFTDEQYRVGAIYNINENLGLKTFYSSTYIVPSLYNIDFIDKKYNTLNNQKYKHFIFEGVYAQESSRFSIGYSDVRIDDFIYNTPIGFINIDHTIKVKNFLFDYIYELSDKNKLNINYFTTNSSEQINNSNRGGYIKFLGEHQSYDYFSALIYRNAYEYLGTNVGESYNFSLGVTYKLSKELTFSLKGDNLFSDATKSLYKEGFPESDFALRDYQREVSFSMRWVF